MAGRVLIKDPIVAFGNSHIVDYPTPSNLNYLWSFGSMGGIILVIQIISGILLAMHYTPHIDLAFFKFRVFYATSGFRLVNSLYSRKWCFYVFWCNLFTHCSRRFL
jgi:hypothetical protein